MKMYFIRHGKTPGNEKKQYIGITDQSLSDIGISELKKNLPFVDKNLNNVEKVYVSPMKRCRETAEIYFPGARQVIVDGLREMNFGIFEAKNYKDLEGCKEYQVWLDSMCEGNVPDGENKADFQNRVVKAFLKTVNDISDKSAVFVVHGGTIMSLFDRLAESELKYYQWYIENGYYYSADWDGEHFENIHCFDARELMTNA